MSSYNQFPCATRKQNVSEFLSKVGGKFCNGIQVLHVYLHDSHAVKPVTLKLHSILFTFCVWRPNFPTLSGLLKWAWALCNFHGQSKIEVVFQTAVWGLKWGAWNKCKEMPKMLVIAGLSCKFLLIRTVLWSILLLSGGRGVDWVIQPQIPAWKIHCCKAKENMWRLRAVL